MNTSHARLVMPFGKYTGRFISEIPTGYLKWLLRIDELDADIRFAAQAEVRLRKPGRSTPRKPPQPSQNDHAERVLGRWYANLAKRYHPDRGGSDLAMRIVNECRETLFDALRQEGLIG